MIRLILMFSALAFAGSFMSESDMAKTAAGNGAGLINYVNKDDCERVSREICYDTTNAPATVYVLDKDDPAIIQAQVCSEPSDPTAITDCVVIVGGNQSLGVTAKTCPEFYFVRSDFVSHASCISIGPHQVLDQAKQDAIDAAEAAAAAVKAARLAALRDVASVSTIDDVKAILEKIVEQLGIK